MARSAALVIMANEAKRNNSNALLRPDIARAVQALQVMLLREAKPTPPRIGARGGERSAAFHREDDQRLGVESKRLAGATPIFCSSDASVSTGAISIGRPTCTALVFPLPREIWGQEGSTNPEKSSTARETIVAATGAHRVALTCSSSNPTTIYWDCDNAGTCVQLCTFRGSTTRAQASLTKLADLLDARKITLIPRHLPRSKPWVAANDAIGKADQATARTLWGQAGVSKVTVTCCDGTILADPSTHGKAWPPSQPELILALQQAANGHPGGSVCSKGRRRAKESDNDGQAAQGT